MDDFNQTRFVPVLFCFVFELLLYENCMCPIKEETIFISVTSSNVAKT